MLTNAAIDPRSVKPADCAPTGPGTPAGHYLRQFWQPVYHSADLRVGHAVPLTIMGEDFTLYRGESGRVCLVDARCPHRGTQLSSGWIEGDDLRCFYHGWKFSAEGQCVEQPAEDSSYCARIALASHPTQEYLGLIFAYFGDGAAPDFPRYPEFDEFGGVIEIDSYYRACNYFQNVENALDMSHVGFVHRDNMAAYNGIGRGAQLRAEESDWGVVYTFTRADGQLRIQQFGMPNIFYMTALPTDPEIGWQESMFWWVPIDDIRHMQFSLHRIPVTGGTAERVKARRQARRAQIDQAHQRVCEEILHGRRSLREVDPARVRHGAPAGRYRPARPGTDRRPRPRAARARRHGRHRHPPPVEPRDRDAARRWNAEAMAARFENRPARLGARERAGARRRQRPQRRSACDARLR